MADLEDTEFHVQASEEEVALMSAALEREDSCPPSRVTAMADAGEWEKTTRHGLTPPRSRKLLNDGDGAVDDREMLDEQHTRAPSNGGS